MMSNMIVADTGPLIALSVLDLIPKTATLFDSIYVPEAVIAEATHDKSKSGVGNIVSAIEKGLLAPCRAERNQTLHNLSQLLDLGEAEALSVAKQYNAIALIDERKGRRVAQRHNINITGTIAILIKLKKEKQVSQISPLLERLNAHGYRISHSLTSQALSICGE